MLNPRYFLISSVIKIKKQSLKNFNAESIENQETQGNQKCEKHSNENVSNWYITKEWKTWEKFEPFWRVIDGLDEDVGEREAERRSQDRRRRRLDGPDLCVCETNKIEDNGLFAIYLQFICIFMSNKLKVSYLLIFTIKSIFYFCTKQKLYRRRHP